MVARSISGSLEAAKASTTNATRLYFCNGVSSTLGMDGFRFAEASVPPSNVVLPSPFVSPSPTVAVVVSVGGGTPASVSEVSLSPVGISCPATTSSVETTGSGSSGCGSGSTPQYLSTATLIDGRKK